MRGGFVPFDASGWPEVAEQLEALGRPWAEAAVVFDLRWHVDQFGKVPSRRRLLKRWSWSDWKVRAMLRDPGRWWDTYTKGPAPGRLPSASQTPPKTNPLPTHCDKVDTGESGGFLPDSSQTPPKTNPLASTRAVDPPSPSPTPQETESAPEELAPSWARARSMRKSDGEPMEVALAVKEVAEVMVQRELELDRMKSHAKAILDLWRADGKRPLAAFLRDLRLVAEAAHHCPDGLFARDLRAEGWTGGTPRQSVPASVCRHERFDDRLAAAKRWHEAGRPSTVARNGHHAPPSAMPQRAPQGGWIIGGKHFTDEEAPNGIPF